MRRKVIAGMIVSLLLVIAGILTSIVRSSGSTVSLRVLPELVECWTPAYGEVFTMNVTVADVIDLFGYEFKLSWNTTLLDCVRAEVTPPVDWGKKYFVPVNEINETLGQYWLAVVALSPAPSFTGDASLARLTFEVTYDPIYPESVSSPIQLFDTLLADMNAETIDHTTHDGEYWCYSSKPVIKVLPSKFVATTGGIDFEVKVKVFNVTNLAHYTFYLTYNATLLDAAVPEVGDIFPYRCHATCKQVTGSLGKVGVIADSSVSVGGSGVLGRVDFTTRQLSFNASCDLHLLMTELKTADATPIAHDRVDGQYQFIASSGDINGDHRVNMRDIYLVARAFGSEPGDPDWNPMADLKPDNKINMIDICIVAINFGRRL